MERSEAMERRIMTALMASVAVGVLLPLVWGPSQAAAEAEEGAPAAAPAAAAEQARAAHPAGWENWSAEKQQRWAQRLEGARKRVREHARARERAAVGALEVAAGEGAPLENAEQAAKAGLDEGLAPADFEPLGHSVSQWTKEGLKGQDLAERIHQEIQRRREVRRQLREEKKARKQQQRGARRGAPGQEEAEEAEGEAGRKPEKVEFIHRRKGPPAQRAPEAQGAEPEKKGAEKGGGKGRGRK
jgi:hypothetical protein